MPIFSILEMRPDKESTTGQQHGRDSHDRWFLSDPAGPSHRSENSSDACGEPSRGQENALWKRFSDPLSEGSPTTIESTTERVNHVNDWKWIHEPFQSILKLWPNESKAKVKAWIGSWMNDLQTWPSARLYFHLLSGERIRRSRYERRSCWTSFPSFFLVSLGKMSTRISMIDAQLHERHVESDRYLSTIDVSLGSWLERWANLRS